MTTDIYLDLFRFFICNLCYPMYEMILVHLT